MHLLKHTFRHWWQEPKKTKHAQDDRSVSFLELFYDLSYVVIIAELTHMLVKDVTFSSILGFVAIFALVWWAWVNGSFYHELHGNNDIRTRIFTFLQMIALAAMAVFAHNVLGDGYQGFAISYSFFLLILTILWWRTGVHDKEHSAISRPYAIGFALTTIIFAVSAFTPIGVSFYLWGVGTVFSLLLPLLLIRSQRNIHPDIVEATQRIRPSLVERFGLLTIIVLGEVIVAVVQGASHFHNFGFLEIILTILGLSIAFGMWWLYFDFVSHRMPIQQQEKRFAWLYLHLPVTLGIAMTGAGILTLLEHVHHLTHEQSWLFVIPVSIFLIATGLLMRTLNIKEENREIQKKGEIVAILAGCIIICLGFFSLSAVWLISLVALLLLAPVFFAFRLWLKRLHDEMH